MYVSEGRASALTPTDAFNRNFGIFGLGASHGARRKNSEDLVLV